MEKVMYLTRNVENKEGDKCPECGHNWDGGDIYEYFLAAKFNPSHNQHSFYKDKTIDEIKESAGCYGWKETNKVRFVDGITGIDLSMDPDAKGSDQYDGVSYWRCDGCEVAWHRFTGDRTEKFIKSAKASVIHKLNELKEEKARNCIYRCLTTPDGTVIESKHTHDYVTHNDKNGETYMLDCGTGLYYRTSSNKVKGIITEVYADEPHEKIRNYIKRGGRGKDGRQPLTWVPVSEMNDEWVAATIIYNEERSMGDGFFNKILKAEQEYREANSILVPE